MNLQNAISMKNKIKRVLRSWDPINVGWHSPDEYDAYADGILKIIKSTNDTSVIVYHLGEILDHMGLPTQNKESQLFKVAERLIGIKIMFEEFKDKPHLSFEDLVEYKFSFSELLRLLDMQLVDEKIVATYLSHLLSQDTLPHFEDQIVRALWSNNLWDLKDSLKILAEKEGIDDSSLLKKIISWLFQKGYLEKLSNFDLVEVMNDLVVHFEFPEKERELFYVSYEDGPLLMLRLKSYLGL